MRNYRANFLYFDRADPYAVSKYKLPVADLVDGKPRIVPHAVYAAAVVLEGGRKGLRLYQKGDEARLESAVTGLYRKMGRTPPEFSKPADPSHKRRTLSATDRQILGMVLKSTTRSRPKSAPTQARYVVTAGKRRVYVNTQRELVNAAVRLHKAKAGTVAAYRLQKRS